MEYNRVIGVDFSADKSKAGRRTWVAETEVVNDGLKLCKLADAAEYLDCRPSREDSLSELAVKLRDGWKNSVVGLDFPFSLPTSLLDGDDWRTFVEKTPGEWGALPDVDSPDDLYEQAKERAEKEGNFLMRTTDEARKGQPPTGFRIKTQTYYGISEILAKIVGDVAVKPMDDTAAADTIVVETYPAALFDTLDGHRTGYKSDTREGISRRKENLESLKQANVVFNDHRDFAVASDDALDAVACAVAAWRAAKDGFEIDDADDSESTADNYAVEGYIYV